MSKSRLDGRIQGTELFLHRVPRSTILPFAHTNGSKVGIPDTGFIVEFAKEIPDIWPGLFT